MTKADLREEVERLTRLLASRENRIDSLKEEIDTIMHEFAFLQQSNRSLLWALSRSQDDLRSLQKRLNTFGKYQAPDTVQMAE